MADQSALRAVPHREPGHDTGNFEQRLKAAGLGGDAIPDDRDEFRNRLARCIMMFINKWHGCPEPLCRRHHGCMAPNIHCTNNPPSSADELERDWPQARVEVYTALQELRAAHGEAWE